jgi:hypothetical protein
MEKWKVIGQVEALSLGYSRESATAFWQRELLFAKRMS